MGLPILRSHACVILTIILFTISSNGLHKETQKKERQFAPETFLDKFNQMNSYVKTLPNNEDALSSQFLQKIFTIFNEHSNVTELIPTTSINSHEIQTFFDTFQKDQKAKSSCIIDVARLVTGISMGKAWATSFLDASGKPGPSITKGWVSFVGNYDQCTESKAPALMSMRPGFSGQYCNLPILFSVAPFPFNIGMCVPSTCSSKDLTPVFKELHSLLNTTFFEFEDVQCLKNETDITAATVIAIVILSVFISLVIIATSYDIFVVRRDNNKTSKFYSEEENGIHSRPSYTETDGTKMTHSEHEDANLNATAPLIQQHTTEVSKLYNSKLSRVLLAFSFYTNGKKLMSTTVTEGSIGTIHGIRFLSTSWIALGHTFVYGGPGFTINFPSAIQTFLSRWTFEAVMNGLLAVDTFLLLSGLLTSYITIQQLWSRGIRINWPLFYFHRYWRLTPPYLCVLVIILGLQQYLGQGALWGNVQPLDKEYCEKNWWTNVLYLNNIINPTEPCLVQSWYLAVEMQFILISPVMLVALYYSKLAGLVCCSCFLVTSWIVTGVLSTHYGWGVTILSATYNEWYSRYYVVPWCRIGPYVIGILTGYVLAAHDGKPFKIRRVFVAIGWVVSIASALAVVYGIDGHFDGFGEHPEDGNIYVNTVYNTLGRSVWAGCVAWVIIACTAGYGGPVNVFLSWSPFVVLGRLSFMIYLVHISVLNVFYGNMGSVYYLKDTTYAVLFLGLMVISTAVAFVVALLFEWPMLELEKIVRQRDKK